MVNEAAISAAIDDLRTQAVPNFLTISIKHQVDRKTLQRRFEGTSTSRSDAQLEAQGLLTKAQERVLVDRINTLSTRGIPPTPAFVENLVQELIKAFVGDRWISRFVKRHQDELESIFLDSIDYARRVADNSRQFKHYFECVSTCFYTYYL